MRVVFAGTPAFAVPSLESLARAGHEVALVLTQPDRPAGRGQRLAASPVSMAAERLGLTVSKPESLKDAATQAALRELAPEIMVVAAYGLLLPAAVLEIPREGCLNVHASLLPRWRGAAPVHRAILEGDSKTGISIMRMEAGLDAGPVLLQRVVPIAPDDTTGTLTDKLARVGGEAIVESLARLGSLEARPQEPAGVTYAAKVAKAEARIDWGRPAAAVARQVRAFNPAPGAEASLRGVPVKIWEATAQEGRGLAPGEVQVRGSELLVGCGQGALQIGVLQRPGGRRMGVEDFLRGNPWAQMPSDHAST